MKISMWGSRWKIGNCVWVPVIGEVNTCTTIKLLANDTILKSQLGLPLTKLYVNIWTIVLWLVSVYIYGSVDEKRIYLHPIFSNSLSCWHKSHLNVTRYHRKFFFSDWSLHLSLLPIYIFDFQSICHRMAHVIVNTPCFGKTIVKNNYRHCTVL